MLFFPSVTYHPQTVYTFNPAASAHDVTVSLFRLMSAVNCACACSVGVVTVHGWRVVVEASPAVWIASVVF